jgi:hypothetical protein
VSLGIGIIVAVSKTKKHYIGLTWAEGDTKGGMVVQADKNEFRGILMALEGITGRRAVGSDDEGARPTAHSSEWGATQARSDSRFDLREFFTHGRRGRSRRVPRW